jgi:hypothetical protein
MCVLVRSSLRYDMFTVEALHVFDGEGNAGEAL